MRTVISRNLRKPEDGIMGLLVSNFLVKVNHSLEKLACELCEIKPDHMVLEVGFGPGLGLKEAADKVSGGSGSVHGIDISQQSFNIASKRLKQEIYSGKMTLHLGSVTNIPYPDNSFDGIFHTNCYYFWSDMDKAVKELHRVSKPGSIIASTIFLQTMQTAVKYGLMQFGNIDPDRYMTSLERNGFHDVSMKIILLEKKQCTAIVARAMK